jgi:anti-sigma regulatory factor (Ser/Thr protein kinase)
MPSRTFPALPGSVAEARRFVTEVVDHLPERLCETAALLTSELATNAVRHGGGADFTVAVEHADGRLRIGVIDTGRDQPILRSPAITDEHGRGLHLVAALADRWGAHGRRDTGAKTVWFELVSTPDDVPTTRHGAHAGPEPTATWPAPPSVPGTRTPRPSGEPPHERTGLLVQPDQRMLQA